MYVCNSVGSSWSPWINRVDQVPLSAGAVCPANLSNNDVYMQTLPNYAEAMATYKLLPSF